ncbi:exodeoxyribonuclease VII large subunit [Nitratifractor sp.]
MQMMSVSALNEKIKSLLEATFLHIRVEGEVASVTYHSSGHLYFSVKDDRSTLRCVMWRSNVSRMRFRLEKGEHIVIDGSIGVYTPRGEYQLIAVQIEPYGRGALALAFEQLKKKLEAKGYFDATRKKPLPPYPRRIALVTAAGGAALQDMLKVARRRWPLVELLVLDVRVQGEGAAEEIARGIAYADTLGADLIVTGRGGGSVEDLWAFNEEAVADAIYAAQTPVVSAVGHEVDTLISDFVADLRAPTPSAAIEMILPDANELLRTIDELGEQMGRRVAQILHQKEERLRREAEAIRGASVLRRLVTLEESFARIGRDLREVIRYRLSQFEGRISPLERQMTESVDLRLRRSGEELRSLSEALRRNDPTLRSKEGWAEVLSEGRRRALESIKVGERFELSDGRVKVRAQCLEKRPLK